MTTYEKPVMHGNSCQLGGEICLCRLEIWLWWVEWVQPPTAGATEIWILIPLKMVISPTSANDSHGTNSNSPSSKAALAAVVFPEESGIFEIRFGDLTNIEANVINNNGQWGQAKNQHEAPVWSSHSMVFSTVSGAKVPTESCGPTQRGPAGQSAGLRSPRRTLAAKKNMWRDVNFSSWNNLGKHRKNQTFKMFKYV